LTSALCVGVLVCWCVGVLVCWCVGVLVCWCVGVLVYWCVGVLVCWCVGVLLCVAVFFQCVADMLFFFVVGSLLSLQLFMQSLDESVCGCRI